MVVDCKKCGEHAYATRYKDSYLSFCRACGYWNEAMGGEGVWEPEKTREMRQRWPLHGVDDYDRKV